MSTKREREYRAANRILPIKIEVRQQDGSKQVQIVDADVREDKREKKRKANNDQ